MYNIYMYKSRTISCFVCSHYKKKKLFFFSTEFGALPEHCEFVESWLQVLIGQTIRMSTSNIIKKLFFFSFFLFRSFFSFRMKKKTRPKNSQSRLSSGWHNNHHIYNISKSINNTMYFFCVSFDFQST